MTGGPTKRKRLKGALSGCLCAGAGGQQSSVFSITHQIFQTRRCESENSPSARLGGWGQVERSVALYNIVTCPCRKIHPGWMYSYDTVLGKD
jgi:hypothetical protein